MGALHPTKSTQTSPSLDSASHLPPTTPLSCPRHRPNAPEPPAPPTPCSTESQVDSSPPWGRRRQDWLLPKDRGRGAPAPRRRAVWGDGADARWQWQCFSFSRTGWTSTGGTCPLRRAAAASLNKGDRKNPPCFPPSFGQSEAFLTTAGRASAAASPESQARRPHGCSKTQRAPQDSHGCTPL